MKVSIELRLLKLTSALTKPSFRQHAISMTWVGQLMQAEAQRFSLATHSGLLLEHEAGRSSPRLHKIVSRFLQLQAWLQKQVHNEAAERNEHWIGVSLTIKHCAHYIGFIMAQIQVNDAAQTLLFVAYILHGEIESPVRQYGEIIPPLWIHLLKDCLPDSATIHREEMVATHHILSTKFRPAFVPLIDCLTMTVFPELNEPILFHHLSKLIMDSLHLATKAANPTNYFLMSFGMHDPMNPANHSDLEDSFVTHSAYQPKDNMHILLAPELEALLRRIERKVKKLTFTDTAATGARRQTSSAGACG
ncbi:hypothetical protein FRC11_002436 [Ceratobasidium sp. 423]|nr:hypothetical protein FRC11_002436 [Ceratobasidium sp. 423]